jgi:hypothetical protein
MQNKRLSIGIGSDDFHRLDVWCLMCGGGIEKLCSQPVMDFSGSRRIKVTEELDSQGNWPVRMENPALVKGGVVLCSSSDRTFPPTSGHFCLQQRRFVLCTGQSNATSPCYPGEGEQMHCTFQAPARRGETTGA